MAPITGAALLAGLCALPFAPSAAAAADDPLAAHRGRERVVVALAASRADPALAEQRRLFERLGAGGRERDLALVEATDDAPRGAALRRRFGGAPGFRAVLVGKDGGEKLSSATPLGARELFPTIDAMPMRREEMRRRP